MIPKKIYKTGPFREVDLPIEIKNIFKKTKIINKGFDIVYFDDKGCEQFIKDNFDKKIYK